MATARDQVEAYNYAARRQVLALLKGDDAAPVDPRRRLNRSLAGGLLLGVVALAAVGVAGFLTGGSSTSLPKSGVIVADGGPYVLIDNVLHPALNLASAKLIAGAQVTSVDASALKSLARGLPVGIPGAPNALPPAGDLSAGAWSVCSIAPAATAARPQVIASVGAAVPRPLPGGAGLVAQTPDKSIWLLDGGVRYRVDSAAATLLGLDREPAVPITDAVLDVVPEGPALGIPTIPGAGGAPSVSLPFSAVVGDLVEVEGATRPAGLYVVLADGLAPVDSFAFTLLAGAAKHTLHVPASEVATVASTSTPAIPRLWPTQALRLAAPPAPDEPLCITYDPAAARTSAAWPVTVSEPARVPVAAGSSPVAASNGALPTAATGVAVPPGGGALVRATATGGVDSEYLLVTDSGLRFPIATADAVTRLGYKTAAATPVPLPFVSLLPAGPGLDPNAASVEYSGSAQPPPATLAPSSGASDAPSGAPPS